MRTYLTAAVFAMIGAGAAMAADPAVGTWQTQVDDGSYGHVVMAPCGSAICGTLARTFNSAGEYDSANKGKKLVLDMKPGEGGSYKGKVWRPSNDKIYIGKMTVSGNALKLSGCVAGGLICSKQTWKRLK